MNMDEKKIDEIVKAAVVADLDGLDFIADFSYAEIAAEYNGIGPEWLPSEIREKLSKHLELFAPAALIHDMRFAQSDGSRYGFNFANLEFRANCTKLAEQAYPWWSWRRYRAYLAAHAMYDFVTGQGGWVAWQAARDKQPTNY